ncbi:HAUS augmin-like complex subunit 6 [Pristis pectinata]|uniref:HAUS augmin-like complex subunit 6 n=1 Tax=Pristis pectinata TaxID=685728 RepID=UPI00223D156E|nr:HAUS augmin-like complex subunit 6 [Pristis pectinata]
MAGNWRKECLWKALLALGFTPTDDEQRTANRTVFGVDMFDKPNVEAFQIVVYYLFMQLDQTRVNIVFRDCWPIYDKKSAACFRKACYEWMKKIADEVGNGFPQVVASLFLSPGGPKFINLMFAFAKYVLTHKLNEELEKSSWRNKVVRGRSQDLHLAAMRCCISRNQFLEGIQKEAFVIEEYKRREALLVNEYHALKKEHKGMKDLLEKAANDCTEEPFQKLKELREMWKTVMDMLLELEKEKEIIDSIMEGRVDLDILDGTDVTLKVPRPLVTKIEKEADQIDDLYKAGKLNPAAINQLCNWSLKLLGDQRDQVGSAELEHCLSLENLAEFLKNELIELKEKSQQITQEIFPSVKQSIAKMEGAWDKKCEQCLNRTGFSPMRKKYPVLDLLPTMPTLSFEPASEEAYKSSVFYSHSATLSGLDEPCTKGSEGDDADIVSITSNFNDPSTSKLQCSEYFTPSIRNPNGQTSSSCFGEESIEIPLVTGQPLESRLQTPYVNKMETWHKDKDQSPPILNKPKSSSKGKEAHQKTVDQLAEEVADIITRVFQKQDLVQEGIFSPASNPFITQNELPRTPENLITDIRNSWRCAVKESELEQMKRQESVLTHPKQTDHANEQVLMKPEESSPAVYMKVSGSFHENTSSDAIALHRTEIDKMRSWSKTPCSPDPESASSNHLSIRNEKWSNWVQSGTTKCQLDCREPGMDCSEVGSENEWHYFNSKAASNDPDGVLIGKILSPLSGSHDSCSSEDGTKKTSGSLINSVTDDEINFGHSQQFLPLKRVSPKSPIKKEKLTKSFIMEMCKTGDTLENSKSYNSLDTECDLDSTLPWNQSQNVTTTPCDSLKFGILQETIPDVLGNDSLNSSMSPNVDQLDDPHLDMTYLRNRLEQLRERSLAAITYGAKEKINLAENVGTSHFHNNTDSKDQCKPELPCEVDYTNEEVDNADKLFTQESTSLKALSPISFESQKPGLSPISLGSSPLNVLELQDDLFGTSLLNPSQDEASQRVCLAQSEISSVSVDTPLDNGVGQLITF